MALFQQNSLNRSLLGRFDFVAADQPILFWFRLAPDTVPKTIWDIDASYINPDFVLAAPVTDQALTNIRGRILVYFGDFDLRGYTNAQLMLIFAPFGASGAPELAKLQIVLDQVILNSFRRSFTGGIKIAPGKVCNIVMTPGFRMTDAGINAFSQSIGSLTVMGDVDGNILQPGSVGGGPRIKEFGA